jgi:transposase
MNVKPTQVGRVAEMRRQGMPCPKIAAELGLSLTTVYQYCAQSKVTRTHAAKAAAEERPRSVRARIQSEVAAGKRCRVCWLLLPCEDHQP